MKSRKPKRRLKPSVKRMWVEALRSGKYKKGKGTLYEPPAPLSRAKPSYCVLGVLVDVYRQKHPKYGIEELAAYRSYPPPEVIDWAFTKKASHSFLCDFTQKDNSTVPMTLDELNDDTNLTFAKIADIIEEQF